MALASWSWGARGCGALSGRWGSPLVVAALAAVCACSEHLPEYADPHDLLSGSLAVQYVMAERNEIVVSVMVRNLYDETLQDTAVFSGTCDITFRRDPSKHKTLAITSANLQWGDYNSTTRILTLDPGETMIMAARWDFVCDDSTDLRTSAFRYIVDPTCRFRHVALSEELDVTLSVTVFKQTAPLELGPMSVSFCHIDTAVPLQLCAPINGDNSCSVLP